jgi:phage terminase large subunit-like protein
VELRASSIASLPPSKRQAFLDSLSGDELAHIEHDWRFWARDEQLAPPGLWRIWLLLAGRGFGKTRVGAEWCHERAAESVCRIAIVGATMDDARKICVDGESGIMACAKPWFRPTFEPSKNGGTVTWPNGSLAELYSGEKPDGLRGPQFHAAWLDELLKWRRMQAAWDMLRFALRLGTHPRTVITTTPTPAKLIKDLVNDKRTGADGLPMVRVVRGSTYANAANLSADALDELRTKYEGTRLGRQELFGEILEDRPGALWTYANIDEHRINDPEQVPKLERTIVAIDPPVTSGEDADECGIVAAGRGPHSHAYVLGDASERGLSPKQWAQKALRLYHDTGAGLIVAEANNGGEMIKHVINTEAPEVKVKLVHASKGKVTRAEPVSSLYEQGRVHHVGTFKALEDQQTDFTVDWDRDVMGYSPDRVDALVWAITELMLANRARGGLVGTF